MKKKQNTRKSIPPKFPEDKNDSKITLSLSSISPKASGENKSGAKSPTSSSFSASGSGSDYTSNSESESVSLTSSRESETAYPELKAQARANPKPKPRERIKTPERTKPQERTKSKERINPPERTKSPRDTNNNNQKPTTTTNIKIEPPPIPTTTTISPNIIPTPSLFDSGIIFKCKCGESIGNNGEIYDIYEGHIVLGAIFPEKATILPQLRIAGERTGAWEGVGYRGMMCGGCRRALGIYIVALTSRQPEYLLDKYLLLMEGVEAFTIHLVKVGGYMGGIKHIGHMDHIGDRDHIDHIGDRDHIDHNIDNRDHIDNIDHHHHPQHNIPHPQQNIFPQHPLYKAENSYKYPPPPPQRSPSPPSNVLNESCSLSLTSDSEESEEEEKEWDELLNADSTVFRELSPNQLTPPQKLMPRGVVPDLVPTNQGFAHELSIGGKVYENENGGEDSGDIISTQESRRINESICMLETRTERIEKLKVALGAQYARQNTAFKRYGIILEKKKQIDLIVQSLEDECKLAVKLNRQITNYEVDEKKKALQLSVKQTKSMVTGVLNDAKSIHK